MCTLGRENQKYAASAVLLAWNKKGTEGKTNEEESQHYIYDFIAKRLVVWCCWDRLCRYRQDGLNYLGTNIFLECGVVVLMLTFHK